jgi:hypothetical protein
VCTTIAMVSGLTISPIFARGQYTVEILDLSPFHSRQNLL